MLKSHRRLQSGQQNSIKSRLRRNASTEQKTITTHYASSSASACAQRKDMAATISISGLLTREEMREVIAMSSNRHLYENMGVSRRTMP